MRKSTVYTRDYKLFMVIVLVIHKNGWIVNIILVAMSIKSLFFFLFF